MFTIFYIAFSLYEISDLLNNIGYIILKYESNWVLGINMLINEAANLLWYIGRLVGWLLLVGRRYDLSDVDIILHFTLSCLYITHTGYTLHLPITTGASTSKMEQMFYMYLVLCTLRSFVPIQGKPLNKNKHFLRVVIHFFSCTKKLATNVILLTKSMAKNKQCTHWN